MNTKLKGILILTGVFALGAVAGAGSSWAWLKQDVADELGGEMGRQFERRHLKALTRELDLTDEQSAKIKEIMTKHRQEREELMRTLADDCGGELRQHREKVAGEIRAVLDPDQQRQFDELRNKQLERFPLMGPPRGRPGGGPGKGRRGCGPQSPGSEQDGDAAVEAPPDLSRYR